MIIVLATNVIPVWILLPLGIDNAVVRPFAVLRLFRAVKLGRLIRKYRRLKILWNLFQALKERWHFQSKMHRNCGEMHRRPAFSSFSMFFPCFSSRNR